MTRRGYHQRPHTRTSPAGKRFHAGRGLHKWQEEDQQYDYDWRGYGIVLSQRPPPSASWGPEEGTVFLQGDDASKLHDELEAATSNWAVNRLIEPYFEGKASLPEQEMIRYVDTVTPSGHALRVDIDFSPPIITARRKQNVILNMVIGAKGPLERKLEQDLGSHPVMIIWKSGDRYSVDFEAGFQRGIFDATRAQLTTSTNTPLHKPYLVAIGLDPKSEIMRRWLGR